MNNLVTINIMGIDPSMVNVDLKDSTVSVNLKPQQLVDMTPVKSFPTQIEELKLEPTLTVMPYDKLSESKLEEMNKLLEGSRNTREAQGIIKTSKDDSLLLVALAELVDESCTKLLGCSILNGWVGQTENQAAILVFIHPDYNTHGIGRLLADRILEEALALQYTDIISRGMKVNYSRRQTFVANSLRDNRFIAVPLFE